EVPGDAGQNLDRVDGGRPPGVFLGISDLALDGPADRDRGRAARSRSGLGRLRTAGQAGAGRGAEDEADEGGNEGSHGSSSGRNASAGGERNGGARVRVVLRSGRQSARMARLLPFPAVLRGRGG